MELLLFLLILMSSYLLIDLLFTNKVNKKIGRYLKEKNDKYYEELIIRKEKSKKIDLKEKLSLFNKINIMIDKAGIKANLLINPITIILMCILSFIICFMIVYSIFKIILLSIIISLPAILLPIFVLSEIAEYKSSKIEKVMLDFLLQLKNYTKISNDIIYAFKQVQTIEPLQSFVNKFLLEVNSGIKFEKAIDNFKEKITFNSLKQVLSNMQYCYTYGGDFSILLDKSYQKISKLQKEKMKRKEETKSARIVLRNTNTIRFVYIF